MTETDKDDSSTHLGTEHETAASPEAATQEGQTSALVVPLTPSEHDGQLATTITQSAQEEGHEFIDPDNLVSNANDLGTNLTVDYNQANDCHSTNCAVANTNASANRTRRTIPS